MKLQQLTVEYIGDNYLGNSFISFVNGLYTRWEGCAFEIFTSLGKYQVETISAESFIDQLGPSQTFQIL